MGSRMGEIRVTTRLSNHNSEQDDLDMADFEALAEEIEALTRKPEYARIVVDVDIALR